MTHSCNDFDFLNESGERQEIHKEFGILMDFNMNLMRISINFGISPFLSKQSKLLCFYVIENFQYILEKH